MNIQTNRADTPKTAFFRQRAEQARRQLADVEVLLIRRQNDAKGFTDRGRLVPPDLIGRIADAKRRRAELQTIVDRSLFQIRF